MPGSWQIMLSLLAGLGESIAAFFAFERDPLRWNVADSARDPGDETWTRVCLRLKQVRYISHPERIAHPGHCLASVV